MFSGSSSEEGAIVITGAWVSPLLTDGLLPSPSPPQLTKQKAAKEVGKISLKRRIFIYSFQYQFLNTFGRVPVFPVHMPGFLTQGFHLKFLAQAL